MRLLFGLLLEDGRLRQTWKMPFAGCLFSFSFFRLFVGCAREWSFSIVRNGIGTFFFSIGVVTVLSMRCHYSNDSRSTVGETLMYCSITRSRLLPLLWWIGPLTIPSVSVLVLQWHLCYHCYSQSKEGAENAENIYWQSKIIRKSPSKIRGTALPVQTVH